MKKLLSLALFILAGSPILASCLFKKSGNYSKNNKFPYVEIWNKEENKKDSGSSIHVLVGSDLAKLPGKPVLLKPGHRVLGWTTDKDQAYTIDKDFSEIKNILNPRQTLYIAVYKNSAQDMPIPESLKVYEIDPNTTAYLSWTKSKGVYPQTGQLGGSRLVSFTESCLDTSKNVKKLTEVTENARTIFKREFHRKEAESAKKQAQIATRGRSASEAVSEYLKEIKLTPEISKALFPKKYISETDYKKAANWYDIVGYEGSPLDATIQEIEKAYKKQVLKFQPDKSTNKAVAEEVTKIINEAYAKIKQAKAAKK